MNTLPTEIQALIWKDYLHRHVLTELPDHVCQTMTFNKQDDFGVFLVGIHFPITNNSDKTHIVKPTFTWIKSIEMRRQSQQSAFWSIDEYDIMQMASFGIAGELEETAIPPKTRQEFRLDLDRFIKPPFAFTHAPIEVTITFRPKKYWMRVDITNL